MSEEDRLLGTQMREMGRRLLERGDFVAREAMVARANRAKRAALWLEQLAVSLRNDGLALLRAFPSSRAAEATPGPDVA